VDFETDSDAASEPAADPFTDLDLTVDERPAASSTRPEQSTTDRSVDPSVDLSAASEAPSDTAVTKPAAVRKPAAPRGPAARKPVALGSADTPAAARTPATRKPATPRTPATRKPAAPRKPAVPRQPANPSVDQVDPGEQPTPVSAPATPRAPRAAPAAGAKTPAARKPAAARTPAAGAKPAAGTKPAARKPPAKPAAKSAARQQPPSATAPVDSPAATPIDRPAVTPHDLPSATPVDPPAAKPAESPSAAVRPTVARADVRPTPALPAVEPAITAAPSVITPGAVRAPKKTAVQKKPAQLREKVLVIEQLRKSFGSVTAVAGIDLTVQAGSIFGIVGPNGAGKTTTLSMVTGLLRPDAGRVLVHGADVWSDPVVAKRNMGVLPDRLRLFDRLTGAQLLHYSGVLRRLDRATVRSRSADLAVAFGLEDALDRLVTDYSAGMMKKIALAAAMIHSPRVLILDEPFEAVDPVSAANVIEILQKYAAAGGTVVMSSHSMDLIQRICDSVSIIVRGEVLASGTMDEVRAGATLEDRFVELAGGRKAAEGMEWLHNFSD
jgi:ABC-2 type transport system ATP-binding protein